MEYKLGASRKKNKKSFFGCVRRAEVRGTLRKLKPTFVRIKTIEDGANTGEELSRLKIVQECRIMTCLHV